MSQENYEQNPLPVIPQSTNFSQVNQTYPQAYSQSYPSIATNQVQPISVKQTKPKKKSKKCLIIGIVVAVVIVLILVIVAIVLAVVLSQSKCRYGSENGKCIECGITYSGNKIVGGTTAVANSWPSIIYLSFNYRYNYGGSWYTTSFLCGGTLVNRDTVVTAAHCYVTSFEHTTGVNIQVTTNQYYPTMESMYTVYAGLHSSNNLNSGVKKTVKSFNLHQEYSSSMYLNDIAIIKLDSKVDLNEKVQIACIPESTSEYPKNTNIDAYIAGWGNTVSSGTSLPDLLMEAVIKIYDKSKCSLVSTGTTKNWNKQICAGKYEGGVDTCQGDSGGPLYVKDSVDGKQRFVLAGVTSYGDGCALAGRPGIYTRVSAYVDWITGYMDK